MDYEMASDGRVSDWLENLRAGDESAREALIGHACQRLQALTSRMLHRFPYVRRWEQTDDVLQNAMIKLHRALLEVQLESEKHFLNLATTMIRRTLLDLAKTVHSEATKHHTDNLGRSADDSGGPLSQQPSQDGEPGSLEGWVNLHEQIESLPDDEREVVEMLFYQQLSQKDCADLLGVTTRTIKRRWQSARLLLFEAMHGESPE